ncbi:hypothetical protein VTN31DRAFT_3688 [Thermomyces dupontii]|uniref:uncharacterized protein n=1 Tax=Talaromyces thermophilus TaxID=28565 RepID=UPI003743BA7A
MNCHTCSRPPSDHLPFYCATCACNQLYPLRYENARVLFAIAVVVLIVLASFLIYHYQTPRDRSPLVTTVCIVTITVLLATVLLLPVDVALVSSTTSSKYGRRKDWATQHEVDRIVFALTVVYYTLYALDAVLCLLVVPFAYFWYEDVLGSGCLTYRISYKPQPSQGICHQAHPRPSELLDHADIRHNVNECHRGNATVIFQPADNAFLSLCRDQVALSSNPRYGSHCTLEDFLADELEFEIRPFRLLGIRDDLDHVKDIQMSSSSDILASGVARCDDNHVFALLRPLGYLEVDIPDCCHTFPGFELEAKNSQRMGSSTSFVHIPVYHSEVYGAKESNRAAINLREERYN